jgi:hypothetical protein
LAYRRQMDSIPHRDTHSPRPPALWPLLLIGAHCLWGGFFFFSSLPPARIDSLTNCTAAFPISVAALRAAPSSSSRVRTAWPFAGIRRCTAIWLCALETHTFHASALQNDGLTFRRTVLGGRQLDTWAAAAKSFLPILSRTPKPRRELFKHNEVRSSGAKMPDGIVSQTFGCWHLWGARFSLHASAVGPASRHGRLMLLRIAHKL